MGSDGGVEPSVSTPKCHAHHVGLRSNAGSGLYDLFEYVLNGLRVEQCRCQSRELQTQRSCGKSVIPSGGNPLAAGFIGVRYEPLPVALPVVSGIVHAHLLPAKGTPRGAALTVALRAVFAMSAAELRVRGLRLRVYADTAPGFRGDLGQNHHRAHLDQADDQQRPDRAGGQADDNHQRLIRGGAAIRKSLARGVGRKAHRQPADEVDGYQCADHDEPPCDPTTLWADFPTNSRTKQTATTL